MAPVKDVEAAVCKNERLALGNDPVAFRTHLFNAEDFWILDLHSYAPPIPCFAGCAKRDSSPAAVRATD